MNKRYTLKFNRRRKGKTNYHKRLRLLKSRKPRLVVRKTNTATIAQVITFSPDGDKMVAQSTTRALEKIGWKHNTGNIPAAYLVGYLVGSAAVKAGTKEAIVDFGMQMPFHGGRLFAAVKGAIDAGLNVPVNEKALPAEDRITGTHIDDGVAKSIEKLKGKVGA